ncbi:MAG TPA: hypothetical protein VJH92_04925 [Candidatus Nanoarchaeia archaeon]|nr:hypothetical protein [Candidatus Nanoarchaeia archaeon]
MGQYFLRSDRNGLLNVAENAKKDFQDYFLLNLPQFSEINRGDLLLYLSSLSDSQLVYESRKYDSDNLKSTSILIPSIIHPNLKYSVDIDYYLDLIEHRMNIIFN